MTWNNIEGILLNLGARWGHTEEELPDYPGQHQGQSSFRRRLRLCLLLAPYLILRYYLKFEKCPCNYPYQFYAWDSRTNADDGRII